MFTNLKMTVVIFNLGKTKRSTSIGTSHDAGRVVTVPHKGPEEVGLV